ncbi:fumarylacetoacetate hydrolase family protein [Rhodococcus ruber]|uniref:Fumarylacetoacetate hydrolase family protein n=1 Tax=Rhodococcus ruber TaxID=1830 RepID=A0ABT4ML92_9NOCA|nr:fumarylacetoacetate hydrolase family protein [Rhodococcus ruber]MCZ4521751.1 fumarylacetoacetate hydrolase family protein [Rhodococcus ruber]
MKFVRFLSNDDTQIVQVGVLDSDSRTVYIVDGANDLLPLIEAGEESLKDAGAQAIRRGSGVDLIDVEPLSPIATPPTVRDFYAFEQHVKAGRAWRNLEMDPDWYALPIFYFSNPYATVGCGNVAMTPGADKFDFELEVAAIVGKGGRNLTSAEGDDAIVGYCVLNDFSGRDVQQREMKLSMGPVKGKDTSTAIGPYLVTKDELQDRRTATGYDLAMSCTVNGQQYSEARWSDVYWSFGEMVSYASRGTDVRPGDILGSGTCGTGCIMELFRSDPDRYQFLQPGDEVVATVEGLGELRNVVTKASPVIPLRDPR